MKQLLLSLLMTTLFATAIAGMFKVQNPLINGSKTDANIDSTSITITPYLYYAQVDISMVVSAKGSYLHNNNGDNLEVVAEFEIDEDVIVVDSWLWIEDYISEAYLIDMYTATNVYESYVTRTQDPSLLKYHQFQDNILEFNIYPMISNSSRKVQLTFLVPIDQTANSFSIEPIQNLFMEENHNEDSYCQIKLMNSPHYMNGSLRTNPLNYSPLIGTSAYNLFEMDMNSIDENFNISYTPDQTLNSFGYTETPNGDYYHMEQFIPMNMEECTFGNLNKIMDNSSIIIDQQLEHVISPYGIKVKETGRYYNNPPEAIIMEYICDNIVYKDTLSQQAEATPIAEKKWAKDRIDELSSTYDANYQYQYYGYNFDAMDIIELSMEHRVLSRFTAFLALPQEDTVVAFSDSNSQQWSVGISNKEENNSVQAFPNPMYENLTILLNFETITDKNLVDIRIVDINGSTVKTFDTFQLISNQQEVVWNGDAQNGIVASPGIYFAIVTYGAVSKTIEIVKR